MNLHSLLGVLLGLAALFLFRTLHFARLTRRGLEALTAELAAERAKLAEALTAKTKAEAEATAAEFNARRVTAEIAGWREESARMKAELEASYRREEAANVKIAALMRERRRAS